MQRLMNSDVNAIRAKLVIGLNKLSKAPQCNMVSNKITNHIFMLMLFTLP